MNFFNVRQLNNVKCSYDTEIFAPEYFGTFYPKEYIAEDIKKDFVSSRPPGYKLGPVSPGSFSRLPDGVILSDDIYDESEIEVMVQLSLLQEIQDTEIIFLELGAGYGAQSLRMHGAVKNQVVPMRVKNCICVGVEGFPEYFQQLQNTFKINAVTGQAIFGGVSYEDGETPFYTKVGKGNYGCSVHSSGDITIPCFKLDTLIQKLGYPHIHVIDMDIQGLENLVVSNSEFILKGKVDYLKISIHDPKYPTFFLELLEDLYECILDIRQEPSPHFCEVKELNCKTYIADGLMIFRRRIK